MNVKIEYDTISSETGFRLWPVETLPFNTIGNVNERLVPQQNLVLATVSADAAYFFSCILLVLCGKKYHSTPYDKTEWVSG
jgi:predicted metal-binding protein